MASVCDFSLKEPFVLESGKTLEHVNVHYETYGTLAESKDNVILICHALTGDAHAGGRRGWWEPMIGEGKPFDTSKYFIVCSNILGGCKGTTGPSSLNPHSQKPYNLDFPLYTFKDIANLQHILLEHLGVKRYMVVGGSVGGFQALEHMVHFPESILGAILIATSYYSSAQNIAFNKVARSAITSDPNWLNGDYLSHGVSPDNGLSIARMIGHITYLSEQSFNRKFSRRFQKTHKEKTQALAETSVLEIFTPNAYDFEVESYLNYQGKSFIERFDANSYLYLTKAMDYFDLAEENLLSHKNLSKVFKNFNSPVLLLSYSSDWLFSTEQTKELASHLLNAGVKTSFIEIPSDAGHDSFLLKYEEQGPLVKSFVESTFNDL